MIAIYLSIGAFIGIMIPTVIGSALPGLTIKILEITKLYKKGTLKRDIRDMISGSGNYERGRVYLYTDKNIFERFESAKVFGGLLIIFVPLGIIISLIIYLLF